MCKKSPTDGPTKFDANRQVNTAEPQAAVARLYGCIDSSALGKWLQSTCSIFKTKCYKVYYCSLGEPKKATDRLVSAKVSDTRPMRSSSPLISSKMLVIRRQDVRLAR